MVQLKIKGINGKFHVYMTSSYFEEELNELSTRLKIFTSQQEKMFSAFFHLENAAQKQIQTLFSFCREHEILIEGIDLGNCRNSKTLDIREETLLNGQSYVLNEDTLLLGNIEPQAYVCCKGSLYVLGCVEGNIDLYYEDNILCASALCANVRICDSKFQNMTFFSPVKVYYEEVQLKTKSYKEEKLWVSLSQ